MKKTLIVGLTAVLALGGVVTAHADDQVTLTFAETMTSPERTLVLEDTIKNLSRRPTSLLRKKWHPCYRQTRMWIL